MSSFDDSKIENRYNELEGNLQQLFFSYNSVKAENQELRKIIEDFKNNNSILNNKIKEINEKNSNLKIVNALHGNTENSQLIKSRINKLVLEVDLCIKQITGL